MDSALGSEIGDLAEAFCDAGGSGVGIGLSVREDCVGENTVGTGLVPGNSGMLMVVVSCVFDSSYLFLWWIVNLAVSVFKKEIKLI